MTVQLNHTIVPCRNKQASSAFLAEVLGRPPATPFGPFMAVGLDNGISMDFHTYWDADAEIQPQHYAFLVSEKEFDQIFGRITAGQLDYWADPMLNLPGEINHHDGGRGVYWRDPDGHLLEIITRPYGGG
jgi:catechol 2,3-dioxygenase-like lactoylglutathione lyase family enzyme